MCNNQECKCVPFKFEVGKVYQSIGDPEYKVKVLCVGKTTAFVEIVTARRNTSFSVGDDRMINASSTASLYWKEYKAPKVETHSLFVKKDDGRVWANGNLHPDTVIGRIVVTVTDGVLTSVEIVKP